MTERALGEASRQLLSAMPDAELIDTLDAMAAAGSSTNGSKLGVLCQAMARILQKFEDNEVVYERDEFRIGDVVKVGTLTLGPVRVVGYDGELGKWILSLDGDYQAWCSKDIKAA